MAEGCLGSKEDVAKHRFEKMEKKIKDNKNNDEKHKEILDVVYLLAFLPSGLTIYDYGKMYEICDEFEYQVTF
jgi:hypothetical protein